MGLAVDGQGVAAAFAVGADVSTTRLRGKNYGKSNLPETSAWIGFDRVRLCELLGTNTASVRRNR